MRSFRIELGSGLKSKDIANEVYRVLGFCPEQQKVVPGPLAESTMRDCKERLERLLVDHGLSMEKAVEVCSLYLFKFFSFSFKADIISPNVKRAVLNWLWCR